MAYYTYILQSRTTGRFYIGQTHDLNDRLQRHNSGRSKATKHGGPWVVYFQKEFETRSEAIRLELFLKGLKNHRLIQEWIENQSGYSD